MHANRDCGFYATVMHVVGLVYAEETHSHKQATSGTLSSTFMQRHPIL